MLLPLLGHGRWGVALCCYCARFLSGTVYKSDVLFALCFKFVNLVPRNDVLGIPTYDLPFRNVIKDN